jgi:hypothetical protein
MLSPPRLRERSGRYHGNGEGREDEEYEVSNDGVRSDDVQGTDDEVHQNHLSEKRDFGVELVLSRTTDSQRAKDMIVPGIRRRGATSSIPYIHENSKKMEKGLQTASTSVGSCSAKGSNHQHLHKSSEGNTAGIAFSNGKKIQVQRTNSSDAGMDSSTRSHLIPRTTFMKEGSLANSVTSRSIDSRSLFDDASETSSASSSMMYSREKEGDTIWRAAKRGDLAALKRFHSRGTIDWAAKDEFQNVPLYYACHSGAIVDINVVRFLLWVTPMKDPSFLEKCKNRKNKAVMQILDEFERSGYTSPIQFGVNNHFMTVKPAMENQCRSHAQKTREFVSF